ncbi:MAG: phospholipid-binding protein MlaC, partial [Alphaproteobacteria bacterium]
MTISRAAMPFRFPALLVAALSLLAAPAMAAAEDARPSPEQARTRIQTLGNEAIRILRQEEVLLEERERQFREILREDFHLKLIGYLVLGHHRRKATEDQLEDFLELFSEFVLIRYAKLLGGYTDEEFVVTGARPAGRRDMAVQSRIVPQRGEPYTVEWVLRKFESGPKIIDVRVENISMVIAQRDEFNAVIQRGG